MNKKILFSIFLIGLIVIIQISPLVAAISYIGKKTDCYANHADGGHAASRACDSNNATDWQASSPGLPYYLVVNLTGLFTLNYVQIVFPAYPGTSGGTIEYWDGASFISDGTFSLVNCNSGLSENVTATLTVPKITTAFKLLFSSPGCASYVTLNEVWPFGDPVIYDFNINISNSTLNFPANNVGYETISATGLNGFSGNMSLTYNSSTFGGVSLIVVCDKSIVVVNTTNSSCIISAFVPGVYTIKFTLTNNTIGKTHSSNVSVFVTQAKQQGLDITLITIILLLFVFIFLFVSGFFERFAMVGAGLVAAILSILGFTWTGQIYVPAGFILLMALCIGLAVTKRPNK